MEKENVIQAGQTKEYSANWPWKVEMSNWSFLGCSYKYPLYIDDLRIGSVSLHSKMQHFSSFSHAAAQDLKSWTFSLHLLTTFVSAHVCHIPLLLLLVYLFLWTIFRKTQKPDLLQVDLVSNATRDGSKRLPPPLQSHLDKLHWGEGLIVDMIIISSFIFLQSWMKNNNI